MCVFHLDPHTIDLRTILHVVCLVGGWKLMRLKLTSRLMMQGRMTGTVQYDWTSYGMMFTFNSNGYKETFSWNLDVRHT